MDSLEELIDQYGDYLLRVAFVYVRNKETAEDIVQEVFISFYRKHQQFRKEASLKTYLVRMTVNRCHDHLKSWSNRTHLFFDTIKGYVTNTTPETLYIQKNDQKRFLQALLKLSMNQREVIVLYYYEEMTTPEIARLLQCAESTIRSRLQRARRQLKIRLSDLEGEGFVDD